MTREQRKLRHRVILWRAAFCLAVAAGCGLLLMGAK